MKVHRVLSSVQPEFDTLVRIYTEAHPGSERKPIAALQRMIERPEYLFLAAKQDNVVVGFSIALAFANSDAALLEYMAVGADHRGRGLGELLFRATAQRPQINERFLLIEVDSDHTNTADTADRERRKAFYRRLGCRQIDGLTYVMPPVSSTQPPLMNMLVYRRAMPDAIGKARLRGWLEACYAQVYQQRLPDGRIDAMLAGLPDSISIRLVIME
jgi:GNAT superfamily N-acetyltransferase